MPTGRDYRIIVIPTGDNRGIWFQTQAGLDYFRTTTPNLPAAVVQGQGVGSLYGFTIRVARPSIWRDLESRAYVLKE